jgi:hypothetical protein
MSRLLELLQPALLWIQNTAIARAISEGDRLFPWIECVHVLALTLVIGSITILDLRLLGLASRDRTVAETAATVLPLTWSAFIIAALSGGLLFASNAVTYAHNSYFQTKMVLIATAGINMAVFHLIFGRRSAEWRTSALTPLRARIIGALSLSLWVGVVACGRWIGFTINAPT